MNKHTKLLFNKARKAFEKNNFAKELSFLNELILYDQNNIELIKQRASCYWNLGDIENALREYAKVVEKNPQDYQLLNNFGVALQKSGNYEHAREILEYATELDSDNPAAYLNLCQVYTYLNLPQDELRVAFKAVKADPSNALAYNNLGSILKDLGHIEDARQAFLTSLAINPNLFLPRVNLAQVELDSGNVNEGILELEAVLNSKTIPNAQRDYVKWSLSMAYLKTGNLEKGWQFYEFGINLEFAPRGARFLGKFPEPKWEGQDLKGSSLLVFREQGVGDEIMFSNCFIDLEELDASVTVLCDPRLVPILKRTYEGITFIPFINDQSTYELCKKFEYKLAMGSLAGYFRKRLEDFDRPNKYLLALPELVEKYKNRLSDYKNKKIIGICWRSGLLSATRNWDQSALLDWGLLLQREDLQFVNLLWGDGEAEIVAAEEKFNIKILRWDDLDLKNDFESIFALMQNLDAVISVSSTPYAMAAFSGVKTILLTPELWPLLGQKHYHPWCKMIIPIVVKNTEHILSKLELTLPIIDAL